MLIALTDLLRGYASGTVHQAFQWAQETVRPCVDRFQGVTVSPSQECLRIAQSRRNTALAEQEKAWSYVKLSGFGIAASVGCMVCGIAIAGGQLTSVPFGIFITILGLAALPYALHYAWLKTITWWQAKHELRGSERALSEARAAHTAFCARPPTMPAAMPAAMPAGMPPAGMPPFAVPPAIIRPATAQRIAATRFNALRLPLGELSVVASLMAVGVTVQFVAPFLHNVSPLPVSPHDVPRFGQSGLSATALMLALNAPQGMSLAQQRLGEPLVVMLAPVLGALATPWQASWPQMVGAGLCEVGMFGILRRLLEFGGDANSVQGWRVRQGAAAGGVYLGACILGAMPDNVWLHVASVGLVAYGSTYAASFVSAWRATRLRAAA